MTEGGDNGTARAGEPERDWLDRTTQALALLGGVVILAAAGLVCVSIGLRWATSNGVPGDFEIVQILVAVAAFTFLPYCQARRGNIFVDTFTQRLPVRLQRALDGLWDLAYAGCAALIAARLMAGAIEMVGNKTTTMMVGLPIGWAVGAVALMAGLLALVALVTGLRQIGSRS